MLPPAIVEIKRVKKGKKGIRLWLPIFLFWPVVMLVLLALIPILFILALLLPFSLSVRKFFGGLRAAAAVGHALKGLTVTVEQQSTEFRIQII